MKPYSLNVVPEQEAITYSLLTKVVSPFFLRTASLLTSEYGLQKRTLSGREINGCAENMRASYKEILNHLKRITHSK